jgi:hypothetical protein
MKTSTRIIDYFKCCMVKQKCKNNITGRSFWAGVWSEAIPNGGLRRLKDLGGGVKYFKLFCEVQRRL